MAYVSLYRRYRPRTFEEVIGQEHVTRTLRNAVAEGRLHHAYLFAGPRGTGKTTTARILAKAVNCERGPTPDPCGTCSQCEAIAAGTHVDVVELDMASHGGVDDARELRERALLAPAVGRRKVYILDEVHMASTAAFNALLKLIEEPPPHVLFTMATTDPQKVLPTIMSRVQRLDLRRVGTREVAAHLRRVVEAEGASIEDGAAELIARAAEGSVRDALSLLEQVLAYSGGAVTTEAVVRVLGHTPAELTLRAADLLLAGDVGGVLALVGELVDAGSDLRRFAVDLVRHLRDLLVLRVAPDRDDLVDAPAERVDAMRAQAVRGGQAELVAAIERLGEALVAMRQGPPRLALEAALARIATDLAATAPPPPSTAPPPPAVDRADAASVSAPPSSRAPATGARSVASVPSPTAAPRAGPSSGAAVGEAQSPTEEAQRSAQEAPSPTAASGAGPSSAPAAGRPAAPGATDSASATRSGVGADGPDLEDIRARWQAVLDALRRRSMRVHAVFAEAIPLAISGKVLTLGFRPRHATFHAEEARKGTYAATLQRVLREVFGAELRVDTTVVEEDEAEPEDPAPGEPAAVPTAEEAVALLERRFGARPVDPPPARGPGRNGR